ncbi:MAG TPA: hypothetical protein VHG09_05165 [Longimicrobiales bacterium]|nr:hypothetical protein [Longimicrobiales bacterium]
MRCMRTRVHLTLLAIVLSGCTESMPTSGGESAIVSVRPAGPAAAIAAGWEIGAIAPDLAAFDAAGAAVSLSDVGGSFVLLEIGGMWCVPSQALAPLLPFVEQALQGEGIEFTSVVAMVDGPNGGQVTTLAHAEAWLDVFYEGEHRNVWHMDGSETTAAPWREIADAHRLLPVLYLLGPDRRVLRMNPGGGDEAWLLEWIRGGVAEYYGPEIESVQAPEGAFSIASPLVVRGTYSDPATGNHTGSIQWGDGTSSELTMNADGTFSSPAHQYTSTGFFAIDLRIADSNGYSATHTIHEITVYDPDGGFVAGAGAMLSPAASCDPALCNADESARFTVLAKYRPGSSQPMGEFRFSLGSGNFTFESTSYDWMMVNGNTGSVKLQGTGSVNGFTGEAFEPGARIRFLVEASDGPADSMYLHVWLQSPDGGQNPVYLGDIQIVEKGNVMVKAGR